MRHLLQVQLEIELYNQGPRNLPVLWEKLVSVTIFCDMDGVLADFDAGVIAAHGKDPVKDQRPAGEWDIATFWGLSQPDFWKPLSSFDFWANLPVCDGALEFFEGLRNRAPVALLTNPSESADCVLGKREWIARNLKGWKGPVYFVYGSKKHIAGPGKILVDDKDENVEEWRRCGGAAVLVPRRWNKRHGIIAEAGALGLALGDVCIEVSNCLARR